MPRLAIATPHRLASEAGAAAFRAGGSAVDAALAAAAVLAVVAPQDCSIGGDVFALVARPGHDVVAVNGSGAAASAIDPGALRERHGDAMPVHGPDPVTVPGAVAAWETIAGLGARRPWRELLGPAVAHAEAGVPVSGPLARAIAENGPLLAADAGLRALIAPLETGGSLHQPALAATLRAVRDDGADALYRGPAGARLVAGLRALGSPLTAADLAAHATEVVAPIAAPYAGVEVLTAPPNSQGGALLELLRGLGDGPPPDPLGPRHAELTALWRRVAAGRDATLADPRRPRHGGDTVAVATLDDEGHAVSLIQSVFWPFGAGILEPATGIVCQNRGAAFSLRPGAAAAPAGGMRPPHTLMPVLVRAGGRVTGAHGTMGGQAQPQIHLQVLLHLLRGAGAQAAVSAPRWIVDPAGRLLVEADAGAAPPGAVVLPALDDELGHAQVARFAAGGGLEAGADPRADAPAGFVVSRD